MPPAVKSGGISWRKWLCRHIHSTGKLPELINEAEARSQCVRLSFYPTISATVKQWVKAQWCVHFSLPSRETFKLELLLPLRTLSGSKAWHKLTPLVYSQEMQITINSEWKRGFSLWRREPDDIRQRQTLMNKRHVTNQQTQIYTLQCTLSRVVIYPNLLSSANLDFRGRWFTCTGSRAVLCPEICDYVSDCFKL